MIGQVQPLRFDDAGVMHRSKGSLVAGWALLVAPLLVLPFSAGGAGLIAVMSLTLSAVAFAFWAAFENAKEVATAIRVDDSGLWVNEVCVLAHAQIASARVVRRGSPPVVEVRARGLRESQRIVVATEDDARALLGALGRDRRAGLRQFTLPSWRWSSPVAMYLTYTPAMLVAMVAWVVIANLSALGGVAGLLVATLVAAIVGGSPAVMSWLTRVVVTIASDGVSFETRLGSRFIPFGEIASVEAKPTGGDMSPATDIHMVNGKRIRLYTLIERMGTPGTRDPVLAALHTGLTTARVSSRVRVTLARGKRTAVEWLEALRATELLTSGYRDAAMSLDELVSVVSDATASDETRAAAGVALASSTDPEARERLRVATEDVASPHVRVALDASLSGSHDELIEALDVVSRSK